MTEPNANAEPRKPKKRRWLLVLLVLALLGGGGFAGWYYFVRETVDSVRAKYRPRFADLRAKLKRVEANLPPVGSVTGNTFPANVNPKPDVSYDNFTGNTAEITVRHDGPNSDGFSESSFRFAAALRENQEGAEPDGRRADSDLAKEYERALAVKYLLVYRVVRFEPIKVDDGALGGGPSFTGGDLDLEVFLVDLETQKPLGAYRGAFRPKPEVLITVRKGKVDTSSARNTIYESLSRDVAVEVKVALDRATSGKPK
jgi:hypothetical protein